MILISCPSALIIDNTQYLCHAGKLAEREDTQKDEDDSPDEQGHVDEDHFVIGGK